MIISYIRLLNQIMRTFNLNIILKTLSRFVLLTLLMFGFVSSQVPDVVWAEFGVETHFSDIPNKDKEAESKEHKEEVDDKDEYEFTHASALLISAINERHHSNLIIDHSIDLSLQTPPPEQS